MRAEYADTYTYRCADPFTAYLDAMVVDGRYDEQAGGVNATGVHLAMLGRHVVITYEDGYVDRAHAPSRRTSLIEWAREHHPTVYEYETDENGEW